VKFQSDVPAFTEILYLVNIFFHYQPKCTINNTVPSTRPSQCPHGLRRGSAPTCLLGLWVRIPQGAWMSVSCECCVLSSRGLHNELIICSEQSYQLRVCLIVCDLETSTMRRPGHDLGCCITGKEVAPTLSEFCLNNLQLVLRSFSP
jgi:hypothetical protein